MIKDSLKRANTYYGISENLKTGFEWIKNNDLKNMADGRYEISDKIYANLQSYLTKDNAPYEAHRDYIDIQYMVDGEELSGVTDYSNCSIKEEYNKEKDIEFLSCNSEEEFCKIRAGEFFVFFPHDAHKPALKVNENKNVKKVIVKVKI
jgi:YhcH/YjgK/YiaL family protein